jgi:hypothetical protein
VLGAGRGHEAQGGADAGGVGAILGLGGEQRGHERAQGLGDPVRKEAQAGLGSVRRRGLGREGAEEHRPHRVPVGRRPRRAALQDLRRDVARRAPEPRRRGARAVGVVLQRLAQPEVEHGDAVIRADQHVARLEVEVEHPVTVQRVDGLHQLPRRVEQPPEPHRQIDRLGRGAAHVVEEVDPLHQLHREPPPAAVAVALLVRRDEVRVLHAGEVAELALEPGHGVAVPHAEQLHRDRPTVLQIDGLVDLTEHAAPDRPEQPGRAQDQRDGLPTRRVARVAGPAGGGRQLERVRRTLRAIDAARLVAAVEDRRQQRPPPDVGPRLRGVAVVRQAKRRRPVLELHLRPAEAHADGLRPGERRQQRRDRALRHATGSLPPAAGPPAGAQGATTHHRPPSPMSTRVGPSTGRSLG